MLTNIHFTNSNAKNIKHLQLYYKLRMHAASNGGSIASFNFTKNERYNILPKLVKNGWIKDSNLLSYRKLCINSKSLGLWTNLDKIILEDLNKFKGWVIAVTEASALRSYNKKQTGKAKIYSKRDKTFITNDWYSCGKDQAFYKTKKISKDEFSGRVYNGTISKLTRVSNRSITRWRKFSSNSYDLRKIQSPYPLIGGRDETKMYRNKELMYITIDLIIKSNINIYSNKYYKSFSLF